MGIATATSTVGADVTVNAVQFLFSNSQLEQLAQMGEIHATNAGQPGFIKAIRSGISPSQLTAFSPGAAALGLDFGGTFIKAAVLQATGVNKEVVTIANEKFSSRSPLPGINHSMYEATYASARQLNLSQAAKDLISAVSLTYSEDGDVNLCDLPGITGHTIIVPSKFEGGIKDQTYLRSIRPGDNIGNICLAALRDAGFHNVTKIDVGNDSIHAALVPPLEDITFENALKVKVGAVVASTGANFTIFQDTKDGDKSLSELANAEGGYNFVISDDLLPPHLVAGFANRNITKIRIERLAGGVNLVDQFFIEVEARIPAAEARFISGIASSNQEMRKISPRLIAIIMESRREEIPRYLIEAGVTLGVVTELSEPEFLQLRQIASGIGQRAAQTCAVMAYTSAANCLKSHNYITNLDAGIAGIFPTYPQDVQMYLNQIVEIRKQVTGWPGLVRINHLQSHDGLSIPNQGGIFHMLSRISAEEKPA